MPNPTFELLLFGDEPVEYRAKRAPKVSRKVNDPDSVLSAFWEPPLHIIERHGGIEQARAFRDSLLAVPLRRPEQWTKRELSVMEGIEARNSALAERQEKYAKPLVKRGRIKTHGKGVKDGKYEHDPVRPLRHDRSLSWTDDPLAA